MLTMNPAISTSLFKPPRPMPPTPRTMDNEMSELLELESGAYEEKLAVEAGISTQRLPESNHEADLVDKLLADELEKLSFEEKERVAFDVHGMSMHEPNDPQDVDQLLENLEAEIRKIPDKAAYEQAKYLNEEYVTDRAFRLMFLRCDDFDIRAAALRIIKHFEVKRDIFGDGPVLARDVRQSDLNEEDLRALQTGSFQILPVRDASGRLVMFQTAAFRGTDIDDRNRIRALFYVLMSLARDEDVQRQGMVVILWLSGQSLLQQHLFSYIQALKKSRVGIPRKIAALHCCIDSDFFRPILAGIRWILRRDVRARTRTHFGNYETLLFQLQTFGIPTECVPITADNKPLPDNHDQWVISRRRQEERALSSASSSSSLTPDIIVPRRFDVLFGRGHHTRNHTGNLRAAHIADMFREKYEAAGKYEKTAIAERIVVIIRESHGRFLKWEDDGWIEVDRQTARNKISHFYRNTRNKASKQPKQKLNIASDSSTSGGSNNGDESTTDMESMSGSSKRTQSSEDTSEPRAQKRTLKNM